MIGKLLVEVEIFAGMFPKSETLEVIWRQILYSADTAQPSVYQAFTWAPRLFTNP